MRFPLAIAACLGLALITMTAPASAQSQSQSASGGHLLVFKDGRLADESEAAGVRILRGSSAPARAAAAPRYDSVLGPGRWQTVAGERLWLFDRSTGKLASCRNTPTANVGERELECTFGTFSRYRRTFGNNFPH